MSEQFESLYTVGVNTEPAENSLERLIELATRGTVALGTMVAQIEKMGKTMASLGDIAETGFDNVVDAVNTWGDSINTAVGGLGKELPKVTKKLTEITGLLKTMSESTSAAVGEQASNEVAAYTRKLDEATMKLQELQLTLKQLGGKAVMPGFSDETMRELFPDIETFEKSRREWEEILRNPYTERRIPVEVTNKAGATFMSTRLEQTPNYPEIDIARAHAASKFESFPELVKYINALREVEEAEQRVALLSEQTAEVRKRAGMEAAEEAEREIELARRKAEAAAQAQIQAAESTQKLTEYFTKEQQSPWSEQYGFGKITQFQESMLKVLAAFDQISSAGKDTNVTFESLVESLTYIQGMRFQRTSTSLMAIRERLRESHSVALELIMALEKIYSFSGQMPQLMPNQAIPQAAEVMPTEQNPASYWAMQAGGAPDVSETIHQMAVDSAREFEQIAPAAKTVFDRIIEAALELKRRMVDQSIIPDMVRDINAWLAQIRFPQNVADELQAAADAATAGVALSTKTTQPGPVAGYGRNVTTEFWKGGELEKTVVNYAKAFTTVDDITGKVGQSIQQVQKEYNALGDTLGGSSTTVTKFADGMVRVKREVDGSGKAFGDATLMASRFLRHITWILQGIVVWGAIRRIQEMGRQYVETFSEIEQQAVRTAFVIQTTTEQIQLAQSRQAVSVAQYGIDPTSSASASTIMAQYGVADEQTRINAARLAMTAQMDMADATRALLSVQRQWNMSGAEGAQVLDTLATMYANAPGEMKDFLDLMQEGPALAEQMGQSFEENMLLISRAMSYLPGRTPGNISSLMGRTLSRVYSPDTAETLARRYNIRVFDPDTLQRESGLDVLDQIAQKFQEVRTESEKAALAELVAGTRQGTAWRDAYVLLQNWTGGIRDANTELRSFDDLASGVEETWKNTTDELTASWKIFLQELGKTGGILHGIQDAMEEMSEGFQKSTRWEALDAALSKYGMGLHGLNADRMLQMYEESGGGRGFERAGSGFSVPTDEFLDWVQAFVDKLEAEPIGRGFGSAARARGADSFGQFRSAAQAAADDIRSAGQSLKDSVEEAGEDWKLNILATMLKGGWTPPSSIVDLTGPKEHPYTMTQVNEAIAQSRAETQRMIESYRSFLQTSGLGGGAIEEAMKNFTDKLMLQLQFFRLPGGEIRLMEGRDLLFYLSKIEENTRPLEGIWNVPEGMRVWVPIESTFYGNWRDKQGAGTEGEFGPAADKMYDAAGLFRQAVEDFKAGVAARAKALGLEDTTFIPDIGWPYSAPEELPPAWLGALESSVREFGNYVALFGQWGNGPVSAEQNQTRMPAWWGPLQEALLNWSQQSGQYPTTEQREELPKESWNPHTAGEGLSSEFKIAVDRLMTNIGLILSADERKQSTWGSLNEQTGPPKIDIPEPLGVNINQGEMTTSVRAGVMSSTLPIGMMTLATAMGSVASSMMLQIMYLSTIARNTASQPTIIIEQPASGGGGSGGGGGDNDWGGLQSAKPTFTREWKFAPGTYEVPI